MITEDVGLSLMGFAIEVVFESLVYGIFVVLAMVSTTIGAKQGWKTRQARIMLSMVWIMLILSTGHWVVGLTLLLRRIVASSVLLSGKLGSTLTAIARINYIIADVVLVWRAWVICRYEFPKTLIISFLTSSLTLALVLLAVILKLVSDAPLPSGSDRHVVRGLDYVLIGTLVSSAVTNILATIIIAIHVWNNRAFLRDNMPYNGATKSVRILRMVAISGWLYSAYVCFVIIVTIDGIDAGAVGSVASVILIHVSGAYPTFVITLAKLQGNVASTPISLHVPRETQTRDHDTQSRRSTAAPTEMRPIVPSRDSLPHLLSPLSFPDFGIEAMQALRTNWGQARRSRTSALSSSSWSYFPP